MITSTAKEFYDQGMEYFENGNWDLAIANFTSSINSGGGSADAYNRRGEAYFCKGDYNRAIENYNRAIAIDANRAIFWLHRGWAYHNQALYNPPTTPAKDWEGHYKHDSQNNLVYIPDQVGIVALNNKALSDINNSLALDSKNHTTWHNRGWLHLNVGNYSQAIEDCNRALEVNSNLPWTWNNRGMAFRRLRKWKEAIRDFDHALSLDPNYQLAINNKRDAVRSRRNRRVSRSVVIAAAVVVAFLIAVYTI